MTATNDAVFHHNNNNNDELPTALPQRAPAEFVATRRIRELYLNLGSGSIEHSIVLLQDLQCIRSLRVNRETKQRVGHNMLNVDASYSSMGFPYPRAFPKAVGRQPGINNGPELGLSIGSPGRNGNEVEIQTEAGFACDCNCFGITGKSVAQSVVSVQPIYVVLGIFRHGQPNPQERVEFVLKPEQLFRKLHWAVYRLRGLRGTFFSLKHVKGFGLYKCDVNNKTHKRVKLDSNTVADLQLLLYMYRKWHVSGSTAQRWADWIHKALNDESTDVPNGTYALELVLGWSIARISTVVLLPVLLSLAIGIYLNAQNWTDLATIQTAWGTASYVVSTGGRKLPFQRGLEPAI
ncbi:hypothetical protein F4679DRAFT_559937 [Xylaria curta]|nr:hypothetical protein F4679DRAFT_559937 [Xylaria curta]